MNLIYFVYLHNNSWRQYCRTVTCYALDCISLLCFVKDDKICVHNDRNESNSLVSVYIYIYITKLRINMAMTFMKNQGCVFDILKEKKNVRIY
jgi:hypothetical protein